MQNETGNIAKLLKLALKPAPPALDKLVMDRVVRLERRRAYRRLAFLLASKIFAVLGIVVLLVGAIWRTTPDFQRQIRFSQLPGALEVVSAWLGANVVYLVPPLVVLIAARIILPKLEK
jgi:hypothetical protein